MGKQVKWKNGWNMGKQYRGKPVKDKTSRGENPVKWKTNKGENQEREKLVKYKTSKGESQERRKPAKGTPS